MRFPHGTAEFAVEAVLETPGPQVPAPGHQYLLSVSRYRVSKVLWGTYARQFVLVAHDRADMSSAAFQPGTYKQLELTSRFPAHASLMNPFSAAAGGEPVFYCLTERIVKPATKES